MRTLDWADVDEVVDTLRATGVPVDLDLTMLAVPGVWAQVVAIDERHRLSGVTFRLRLYLCAPDIGYADAMRELATLHNAMVPVVADLGGPTGDVDLVVLDLPNGSRVPALVVPLDVETE